MSVGDRLRLQATVTMTNGESNSNVYWSSSDDTLAVVDRQTGDVAATRAGQVTIRAAFALDASVFSLATISQYSA
jgi:uncharacterized protein YjdB